MTQAIHVPTDDITYVIAPDVLPCGEEEYRGQVTVHRAGNNIRIDYECEHVWRTRDQAMNDASEMAVRLARVLRRGAA